MIIRIHLVMSVSYVKICLDDATDHASVPRSYSGGHAEFFLPHYESPNTYSSVTSSLENPVQMASRRRINWLKYCSEARPHVRYYHTQDIIRLPERFSNLKVCVWINITPEVLVSPLKHIYIYLGVEQLPQRRIYPWYSRGPIESPGCNLIGGCYTKLNFARSSTMSKDIQWALTL